MKKSVSLFLFVFVPILCSTHSSVFAQQVNRTLNEANAAIKTGAEMYQTLKGIFGSKKPKESRKNESKKPETSSRKVDVYQPETTDRSASTADAMKWYEQSESQSSTEKKIEFLNKAIKADPAFVDAYYNRAYYLGLLDEYEKAITDLDRVIAFRSGDAAAYNDRGYCKIQLNRFEDALSDFGQAIAHNVEDIALAYKNRGTAYMNMGGEQLPLALRDFDNALLHRTDYTEAKYAKASCLLEMNRHKEALQLLNELVLQNPNGIEAWYLRGISNAALRQDQEAINDYNHVIKIDPTYLDAFFARGIVKMTMENYEGAIEDYTQVVKLNKEFAEAYNNRGYCYVKKKKKEYELAIRDFTSSIEYRHPDKYLVYCNRADALMRLGSYAEAKKDYQLALSDKVGHAPAIEGIQQCDGFLNPVSSNYSITARKSNFLKRFALVIGNSQYTHSKSLEGKPLNDADDMAQRLEELGFVVVKLKNASLTSMNQAINSLILQAKGADLVTIFFAGHGIESEKKNYLLPVDAQLNKIEDAINEAISLDHLLEKLKLSQSKMNLVFLDACRNDPFRSWGPIGRDSDSTMAIRMRAFAAPPKLAPDVMVYYATQPKDVAGNGSSRNGNLTQGLLRHLRAGAELKEMWQSVTNTVYREITKEIQLPYSAGTLTTDLIF